MDLYSTKVENGSVNFLGGVKIMSDAQDDTYFSFPYVNSSSATLLTTAHSGSLGTSSYNAYPIVTYGTADDRMYVLSGLCSGNPSARGIIYNTSITLNTQFGTSTTGTFSFNGPESVLPADASAYVYFTFGEASRSYGAFKCTYNSTTSNGTVTWTFTYSLCGPYGYAPAKIYATVVLIENDGQT